MDRAAHAVVVDFAAYRAARAATRAAAASAGESPDALTATDPARLERLKHLTPREITHRARMLRHLEQS